MDVYMNHVRAAVTRDLYLHCMIVHILAGRVVDAVSSRSCVPVDRSMGEGGCILLVCFPSQQRNSPIQLPLIAVQ